MGGMSEVNVKTLFDNEGIIWNYYAKVVDTGACARVEEPERELYHRGLVALVPRRSLRYLRCCGASPARWNGGLPKRWSLLQMVGIP